VAVRKAVDLPILCKDFIIDPIQIDQAHAAGATIILLIAAALSKKEFIELYQYASSKGLEVLCEVHDKEEMNFVLDLNVPIIGINNRNLETFTVDLATTTKLATLATKSEAIIVSESGLKTRDDVEQVEKSGAHAILVGETLMRSHDLQQTITELRVPIHKERNIHARYNMWDFDKKKRTYSDPKRGGFNRIRLCNKYASTYSRRSSDSHCFPSPIH